MSHTEFQIRQIVDEIILPETGRQSTILLDDAKSKVVLFGFAAGAGLGEHVAPHPAIIQIIKGEATLTLADEMMDGKPGTWIHMAAKTRHSVVAKTPMVMLLTLLK